MPIKFRFGWVPFLATLFAASLGVSLGQWQSRRAAEKDAIAEQLADRQAVAPIALNGTPRSIKETEYRRVLVRGEFLPGWTVYLDNRPHNGEAGFYLLTPFKIDNSDLHVLVARGWIKRDPQDRTKLPSTPPPKGMIELQGTIRSNPGHLLQLGSAEPVHPGAILQNVDVPAFAAQSKLSMEPFLIEQSNDTGDGLVRDWSLPSSGADKHRAYAFQWYALAATAVVFFLVTGYRRGRT